MSSSYLLAIDSPVLGLAVALTTSRTTILFSTHEYYVAVLKSVFLPHESVSELPLLSLVLSFVTFVTVKVLHVNSCMNQVLKEHDWSIFVHSILLFVGVTKLNRDWYGFFLIEIVILIGMAFLDNITYSFIYGSRSLLVL